VPDEGAEAALLANVEALYRSKVLPAALEQISIDQVRRAVLAQGGLPTCRAGPCPLVPFPWAAEHMLPGAVHLHLNQLRASASTVSEHE
jgi:hypothetical protein